MTDRFWPLETVQLGYNPTHIRCNAAWTPAGLQAFVGVFRGIIDSGGESFSLEKAGNAEKDGASGGIRTHDPSFGGQYGTEILCGKKQPEVTLCAVLQGFRLLLCQVALGQ